MLTYFIFGYLFQDAHNCIAKFDENSSLFAVYDGHGGAEVAIYLSRHLPDMLKACVAYKNGEFIKALEECYLKIDASIKTPEVLQEIQKIAKKANDSTAEADEANLEEAAVDYEKENVAALYEEATMPIEDLVAKYQSGNGGEAAAGEEEDPNCKPGSSKSMSSGGSGSSCAAGGSAGGSSSSTAAAAGGSSSVKVNGESSSEKLGDSSTEGSSSSSSENKTEVICNNELIVEGKKIELQIPKISEKEEISEGKSKQGEEEVVEGSSASPSKSAEAPSTEAVNGSTEIVKVSENGVKSKSAEEKPSSEAAVTTIPSENGETKPTVNGAGGEGGEGETTDEPATAAAVPSTPESTTPRRKKTHPVPVCIPKDEEKDETRRSSPRKSRQSPSASMDVSDSDESDEDDAGYNVEDDSDSSDDEEEDLGDDSDDDDEDEYDDDDAEEDENFLNQMQEPGYDSGATAVVCFMKWGDNGKLSLYVANAGDSRCVVCREGKAVDMSHDHKPELEEEAQRIVNAGGKVTEDGRVNGGLNLSRALGDHSYKTNEELAAEEQMISPLPSVEQIVLEPGKDKFVVLACDGIWNSMGSQEVVDFVGERLQKKENLSKICEQVKNILFLIEVNFYTWEGIKVFNLIMFSFQLFDNCLAPDTHGDGTGCDNMTCIIVQLNETTQAPEIYSGSKRKLSSEEDNAANPNEAESVKKSRVEVSSD